MIRVATSSEHDETMQAIRSTVENRKGSNGDNQNLTPNANSNVCLHCQHSYYMLDVDNDFHSLEVTLSDGRTRTIILNTFYILLLFLPQLVYCN